MLEKLASGGMKSLCWPIEKSGNQRDTTTCLILASPLMLRSEDYLIRNIYFMVFVYFEYDATSPSSEYNSIAPLIPFGMML